MSTKPGQHHHVEAPDGIHRVWVQEPVSPDDRGEFSGPTLTHERMDWDEFTALRAVMTGVDPADDATAASAGRFETDYTQFLDAEGLRGVHIGIARDSLGQDAEVNWIVEASLDVLRDAGATVVDMRLPQWLLDAPGDFYAPIRYREVRAQIAEYLATLKPGFPTTLPGLIDDAVRVNGREDGGVMPNPGRWRLMREEDASGALSNPKYRAVREHGLPLVRAAIAGIMDAENLAAFVYPTSPRRPGRADMAPAPSGGGGRSATRYAN